MLFNYHIDFHGSKMNDGITHTEIKSVVNNNPNHKVFDATEHNIMIGYSEKKRIILISFVYVFDKKKKIDDIKILKSMLPDEIYIKEFYCKA